MKYFLLFALFVFLALPVLAQEKLREIDLRVNGVGSGASYRTVSRKVGKPLRIKTTKFDASSGCSGSAETHVTLFYSGLEITLLGDGKGHNLRIYSIEVKSKKWFVSGIRIGMDMKQVVTKFGSPNSKTEQSGETFLYYVTKGNLGLVSFSFRGKKLVRVEMSEALC